MWHNGYPKEVLIIQEHKRAQRIAEIVGREMYARDNAVRALGIELEQIGPGQARMGLTLGSAHVNSHGIAHGGVIYTLADATFGYACNAYNFTTVAAQCEIAYMVPGRLGERLTAVGEERFSKGRSGIYDITVTNQKEEVIVMFRGHSRRIEGHNVPDIELQLNRV